MYLIKSTIMEDGTKEDVVSSKENVEEIKEDNSEQEKIITGELRNMKVYSLLAFISYFLLIINTIALLFINWGYSASTWRNFFFIVLSLATISSFSIYIYLRSNDERFEYSFWKGPNSYTIKLFRIILFLCLIPFSFIILEELLYTLSGPGIIFCLYFLSFWLVFFSLTFNKKFIEITDDDFKSESVDDASKKILSDVPKTGIGSGILEMIFGFSGCIVFVIGLWVVQWASGAFGPRYGTFANAIPFYAISFVLLILAFAMRLNAKSSSQDSAQKEWIKANNWKKFKTRTIGLVVVFSLLIPLLWYENESYWENEKDKYINLDRDCNDAVIGPDLNLVNADLSGLYLYGCDLSNRDLTGVDFASTELRCADFSNSILVGANFGSYYGALAPNIEYVTFDNADLSNANFSGNGYESINSFIYSRYRIIPEVDCSENVSFKGANLTNTYFDTEFTGSNRGGSKLIFDNAIMDNVNFVVHAYRYEQISFNNAIIDNATFRTIGYDGYNWNVPVSMVNVSFIGTDISMHLPPGSNLSYSDFSYSNMLGAKLENATLTGVIWHYTTCPDGTNSGETGSCVG